MVPRPTNASADTDGPQGILAVIEPPIWSEDDLAPELGRPVLVVDAVQDPGNLGALFRTALSLSGAGVILLSGSAHQNHPKVLRGAMGATFLLPVVPMDVARFLSWLEHRGVRLWVAEAGGKDIRRVDCSGLIALVIGSEGAGVRRELVEAAAEAVSVSISQQVESLNVAVAAGILLHEIVRDA